MNKTARRIAVSALAVAALAPTAIATADDIKTPQIGATAATTVTATSAVLTAQLDPKKDKTTYAFEYGTTARYGQQTGTRTLGDGPMTTVTVPVTGLTPSTVYHARIKAENKEGRVVGEDLTFTTAAAPPATKPATPIGAPGAPGSTATPAPVAGQEVVVAPAQGTVKVKAPGGTGYTTLAAGDAIPVGSVVDTRQGAVTLTSAVSGGETQTATLGGAMFQVKQAADAGGMTDIVLRGGDFGSCGTARAASASASTRRPTRRLWAKDDNGRFRTHGRHSVATVRGTSWITTDTCAGTRTTVRQGAVAVRDLHRKKTVLVRAGHSYLARTPRR